MLDSFLFISFSLHFFHRSLTSYGSIYHWNLQSALGMSASMHIPHISGIHTGLSLFSFLFTIFLLLWGSSQEYDL